MSEQGMPGFQHTVVGVVNFNVDPGDVDTWREQWQGIARQAEQTPGCLYFHLAQNTRQTGGFAVITAWNPGSAWLSFIQSVPALKDLQTGAWQSPFAFYVVIDSGEPLPWRF